MSNIQAACIGILIPFLGTSLGSALVFLLKNKISDYIQKILLGFSAGVMMAASVWSLLIPSINMTNIEAKWLPAVTGFMIGIIILMIIDKKVENLEFNYDNGKNKSTAMLVIAVTLHNIPEGMAVGVIFAGLMAGSVGVTMAGAFALSLGIAIQNIPEGAIISMPLKGSGISKLKSFLGGVLSGIVEPIGALITVLLTGIIVPALPYLLSFAAGAMIYVVVAELIPQMNDGEYKNIGIISLAIGFSVMMILDVALG